MSRSEKSPFAAWLESRKPIRAQAKKRGWTVEDFVREAGRLGVNCRVQTAYKWRSGAIPRPSFQSNLSSVFPSIKF